MKEIIDCTTNEVVTSDLTSEEIIMSGDLRTKQELTALNPSEEEIRKAEIQLVTLNTLMEVGLI